MKGFIKIFEAVVASIIIIATLTFFTKPLSVSDWKTASLQIQSQDILASLHKSGILAEAIFKNDTDILNKKIAEMLPNTVDFSLEISGSEKKYKIGSNPENGQDFISAHYILFVKNYGIYKATIRTWFY